MILFAGVMVGIDRWNAGVIFLQVLGMVWTGGKQVVFFSGVTDRTDR